MQILEVKAGYNADIGGQGRIKCRYWRSRNDIMQILEIRAGYWRSRADKLEILGVKSGYNWISKIKRI